MEERYEVIGKDGDLKGFLHKEPLPPPHAREFIEKEDLKFKGWMYGLTVIGALIGFASSIGLAILFGVLGLIGGTVIGSINRIRAYKRHMT
jgi:hypothetical protein